MKSYIIYLLKKIFKINNLTLYFRKKRQKIERFFYKKKYTTVEIIETLKVMGVKPGSPVIIHSSMQNFYNYQGTAEDLIDAIINFLGPNGTLCMPSFMHNKQNENNVFDVKTSKSSAGYLTEVFRNYPGVKRSLNQLQSVCALGKDADRIIGEHHMSRISFDEHSPFFIIGQLGGYIVNLGLPKWFIGTGAHVCEALLYDELQFFKDKFSTPIEFTTIDYNGIEHKQIMYTRSKHKYVRKKTTTLFDRYFDKSKYSRKKISNIWITVYDMKYLYETLTSLAKQGITIFKEPKFYR